MNENKEINCGQITKWLRVMVYVAIVSLVNAIVNIKQRVTVKLF